MVPYNDAEHPKFWLPCTFQVVCSQKQQTSTGSINISQPFPCAPPTAVPPDGTHSSFRVPCFTGHAAAQTANLTWKMTPRSLCCKRYTVVCIPMPHRYLGKKAQEIETRQTKPAYYYLFRPPSTSDGPHQTAKSTIPLQTAGDSPYPC
jgi:hypothetical protein